MGVSKRVCYVFGVHVDLLLLVLREFQGRKSDQPDTGPLSLPPPLDPLAPQNNQSWPACRPVCKHKKGMGHSAVYSQLPD